MGTDRLTPLLLLFAELDALDEFNNADEERVGEVREEINGLLGANVPARIRHAHDLIDEGYMNGVAAPAGGGGGV
jgi:hypothetical protein